MKHIEPLWAINPLNPWAFYSVTASPLHLLTRPLTIWYNSFLACLENNDICCLICGWETTWTYSHWDISGLKSHVRFCFDNNWRFEVLKAMLYKIKNHYPVWFVSVICCNVLWCSVPRVLSLFCPFEFKIQFTLLVMQSNVTQYHTCGQEQLMCKNISTKSARLWYLQCFSNGDNCSLALRHQYVRILIHKISQWVSARKT